MNNKTVTYSLDSQYSKLRINIAVQKGYDRSNGVITITADDEVVYTSPILSNKTEPYEEIDIPINNCKLLTIQHSVGGYENYCILSNAVVYN